MPDVLSEKAPLMDVEKDSDHRQEPTDLQAVQRSRAGFQTGLFRVISSILIILGLIILFTKPWQEVRGERLFRESALAKTPPDIHSMRYSKSRTYPVCSSIVSKNFRYEFNIPTHDSIPKEWRLIDTAVYNKHVKGQVVIARGDFFQESDIEVHVSVRSSKDIDFDNSVKFSPTHISLRLDYRFETSSNDCVVIDVVVYLRPYPKIHSRILQVHTNNLDIRFQESLNWEVDNLIVNSAHGDLVLDANLWVEPLVAHNVSFSTIYGTIFGIFVPYANLKVHSDHGMVDLWLMPHLLRDRPFYPENVSISTISADIWVQGFFEGWALHPYTHRIDVATHLGNIHAAVPHGLYTNVSSIFGDIWTVIQPFGASGPDIVNEIYTRTEFGSIRQLWLFEPQNETRYEKEPVKYNSIFNLVAHHEAKNGTMDMQYPHSWCGHMEARINDGEIFFDARSHDNDIKKGDGYVKLNRTHKGSKCSSQVDVHMNTGSMKIEFAG